MLRAAVIWLVPALPAAAQDVHARIGMAFDGWLGAHGATGAVSSGLYKNGNWHDNGAGQAELASVAKAITAMCAMHLVEEGALDWSDTVAARLGKGPEATVAQLATHTSGLTAESTQVSMGAWLSAEVAQAGHQSDAILDVVDARGADPDVVGRYVYNNENYALLALMIESASGAPYLEACWSRLGLDTGIKPGALTGAFAPWGGMQADHGAYLDFLQRAFGPASEVGSDPFAFPHVEMGGGVYYGLGMVFRQRGEAYNFWHFGALCFPGRLNAGSFAVLYEGKVSALATYDACVDWDAMAALDGAMVKAVYGQ